MTKVLYIAVMLGVALGGVYAFAQLNFAAAAFAGMAFFAWTHAFNLRFPSRETFARILLDYMGLSDVKVDDARLKVTEPKPKE